MYTYTEYALMFDKFLNDKYGHVQVGEKMYKTSYLMKNIDNEKYLLSLIDFIEFVKENKI